MLCTYGGDPNAAYRIARCLQQTYKHFTVAVAGFCKSAGTLLLLGANSLVLLDKAELGPLDIQLRKSDEPAEFSSGLTPTQAMNTLTQRATESFTRTFGQLKSRLLLTTKTAAEFASKITVGLYQPIMEQLDPMRIGEMDRELSVAEAYGERLTRVGQNLKEGGLQRLVAGYPSHDFVIDRVEAKEMFKSIQDPTDYPKDFWDVVQALNRNPVDSSAGPFIFFMDREAPDDGEDKEAADGDRAGPRASPDGQDGTTHTAADGHVDSSAADGAQDAAASEPARGA